MYSIPDFNVRAVWREVLIWGKLERHMETVYSTSSFFDSEIFDLVPTFSRFICVTKAFGASTNVPTMNGAE